MGIAYNTSIVRDGLVLHLDAANVKSYPGSGTTWSDLSGNSYDAIMVNGVTYNSGGMYFDGSNDYAYIKSLNYGGGVKTISELTVDVWFRTSFNSGSNTGDGSFSDTNNWAFIDFDRNEVFNFFIEGRGQIKFGGHSSNSGGFSTYYDIGAGTSYLLNDGQWHQACVTFSVSNQNIKFYIDGNLVRTANANGSMTALGAGSNRYGFIGDGSEATSENSTRNNFYYQGDISSVKLYDTKALTDAEIKQNFEALRGRYGI